MSRRKRPADDEQEFIVNIREPGLGTGVLLRQTDEYRTYRFVRGGERTFKTAYCGLYIKAAVAVAPDVRALLKPPPAPPATIVARATHPELEAQIDANPDDPGPYLVYADWLQQQQDPRGELIAIHHARAQKRSDKQLAAAEEALLAAHGAYFIPSALDRALHLPGRRAVRCEASWRLGFWDRIRLARGTTPAARELELDVLAREVLDHPSGRLLRALTIGQLGTDIFMYAPFIAAIAKAKHPRLQELEIGDFGPDDIELASTRAGNVSGVFRGAPALRKLAVKAGSLWFAPPIQHAAIREVRVEATSLTAVDLDGLVRAKLPSLTLLAIKADQLELTGVQLEQLVSGVGLPALRQLTVHGTRRTRAILDALAGSPLLARLDTLELDRGDLDAAGAEALLAQRSAFAHLRTFSVTSPRIPRLLALRLASVMRVTAAAPAIRFHITEADVVRLAPDAASMAAARKLARADKWIALGHDPRRDRVWGEYEGTDHYYVFTQLGGVEHGCDCGSPKDPCKHVLALSLLAAHQHDFPEALVPAALVRNSSQDRPSYGRDYDD